MCQCQKVLRLSLKWTSTSPCQQRMKLLLRAQAGVREVVLVGGSQAPVRPAAEDGVRRHHGVAAQVEIESKSEAKVKASYHFLASKRLFPGAFNLGLIGSTCTTLPRAQTPGSRGSWPRRKARQTLPDTSSSAFESIFMTSMPF